MAIKYSELYLIYSKELNKWYATDFAKYSEMKNSLNELKQSLNDCKWTNLQGHIDEIIKLLT